MCVRGHYYTEQCFSIIVTPSRISCVSCIKVVLCLYCCVVVLYFYLFVLSYEQLQGIGNHYSVLCIIIHVTIVPH